jgi:hypothetical protein
MKESIWLEIQVSIERQKLSVVNVWHQGTHKSIREKWNTHEKMERLTQGIACGFLAEKEVSASNMSKMLLSDPTKPQVEA